MPLTKNKVHYLDEPQKMLKNLLKQKTEGIFCDVKLCLQGSVTWGHACVLAPLSSYIMERFRPNSDSNHWCPQKPLVIDLDLLITVSQDKCALCLSTLVNFMYSQDLILLDGHHQHFSKMIYYLKIVDLFPFINTYLCDGNLTTFIEEPKVQEFPTDSLSDNDLLETAQNDKTAKLLTHVPKRDHLSNSLLGHISEITNSYQEQPDRKKRVNTSEELNQSNNDIECQPSCSENLHNSVSLTLQNFNVNENVDIIVEEHNYGSRDVSTLKSQCEFLCCSAEIVEEKASLNHRRKISCEMCSFTAVSVKKVLKHIECVGHLGTMCPICTQKFQNADSLQQHLKDHNNSKPYLCQFCSKRNKFWEFYKIHLKVHCRNKKLCCEICQKSFKSEVNLKVHLKSHTKSYLCSSCNYLTPDADAFKSHLLIHSEKTPVNTDLQHSYDNFNQILDDDLIKHKTVKKFLCNLCGEGFTKKSNLKRHSELKHSNVPNFNCEKCTYVTKRRDLFKSHMKKHHNCLPDEVKCPSRRVTKRASKKPNSDKDQSEVVGVLIPVQLVSTNDSPTLNVFAVKTCVNGESEREEDSHRKKFKLFENDNSATTSISAPKKYPLSNNFVGNDCAFAENDHTKINGSLESMQTMPCLDDCSYAENSSDSLLRNNEACVENNFTENVKKINRSVNNLQSNSNADDSPCNKFIDVTQPVLNMSQEFNDLQIVLEEGNANLNSMKVGESDLLAKSGEFWLSEATGEFLNENSLVNVQVIDTSCRFKSASSSAENPLEDPIDPLHHTLILSDTSQTILDLRDEVDEFKSNPQTPQANLVEVDDPDNLFPWSCIDNSFCSTWVLNEATGELNMVSFNVQPIKHSDESKLDENTGMFSPRDDDETALFLNEGTGDLSVIYFNPSKRECDSSKQLYSELGTQDIPDNVSEHSNEEDDFLNAEFFKATASFMAHKGNETFLNELTGEFDTNVADFSNYYPDMIENQISGSESYLNEETGEILWNVLNKNVGSDFFTNSEGFTYDPDDSLNCDDFEPFVGEINDFSAQFCLEPTQDWRSVDETCDILLNECTGELIKKS